jgi:hypothetical protein
LANKFSTWLARKTLPKLIKTELNSKVVGDQTSQGAKVKVIYQKHKDLFKKYDIKLEEVAQLVEKESKIKQGFMARKSLQRVVKSVDEAIKEGRIEFVNDNSIVYIDRNEKEFHYTFDEMADRLFNNIGGKIATIPGMGSLNYSATLYMMGISSLDMRKIIDNAYKNRKEKS